MEQLIKEYNEIYPTYASNGVVELNHTFDEASNSGKPNTFQRLTVNGMNGIVIPWKIQCKLPPKTKRFCPLVLK